MRLDPGASREVPFPKTVKMHWHPKCETARGTRGFPRCTKYSKNPRLCQRRLPYVVSAATNIAKIGEAGRVPRGEHTEGLEPPNARLCRPARYHLRQVCLFSFCAERLRLNFCRHSPRGPAHLIILLLHGHNLLLVLLGLPGFEPGHDGSKPPALPLRHRPVVTAPRVERGTGGLEIRCSSPLSYAVY